MRVESYSVFYVGLYIVVLEYLFYFERYRRNNFNLGF